MSEVSLYDELEKKKISYTTLGLGKYLEIYIENVKWRNGTSRKIKKIRLRKNFTDEDLQNAINDIFEQVQLLGTTTTFKWFDKYVTTNKKGLYGIYKSQNLKIEITDFQILVDLLNQFYKKEKSKMFSRYNEVYIDKSLKIINKLKEYLEKEQSNSNKNKLNINKKNIVLNNLEKKFSSIFQPLNKKENSVTSSGGKKPVKKITTKKTTTKKPVKKTTTKKPTTKKTVKKTTTKKTVKK